MEIFGVGQFEGPGFESQPAHDSGPVQNFQQNFILSPSA